jgi:predicted lipoprotein with Yx(FWY)xxD motif
MSSPSRVRSTLSRAAAASAGLVLLLGAVACGSGSAPAADPAAEQSHGAHGADGGNSAEGGHGAESGHGGHGGVAAPTLYAVQTGPLGIILTDGSGHPIYRSNSDSANPPTSNCTGPCTETWLPVLDPGEEFQLAGVNESLVGRIQRADGGMQLTLGGWPLYRNRDDDGSLTTAGHHGEAGTWFVVTPRGEVAAPPA